MKVLNVYLQLQECAVTYHSGKPLFQVRYLRFDGNHSRSVGRHKICNYNVINLENTLQGRCFNIDQRLKFMILHHSVNLNNVFSSFFISIQMFENCLVWLNMFNYAQKKQFVSLKLGFCCSELRVK